MPTRLDAAGPNNNTRESRFLAHRLASQEVVNTLGLAGQQDNGTF